MKVPLGKVVLNLNGRAIVLDLDTDDDVLTVTSAKAQAAAGHLTVRVNDGKPLTDAQIDLLVPSWQKAKGEALPEGDAASTVASKARPAAKQKKKARRDWDDASGDAARQEEDIYEAVRSSMDEALSGVSDCERLTDDEMQKKVTVLIFFSLWCRQTNYVISSDAHHEGLHSLSAHRCGGPPKVRWCAGIRLCG